MQTDYTFCYAHSVNETNILFEGVLMSLSLTRPHTKWPVTIGLGIVGAVVVTLVVLAFLWPTKTASPHNLPVGIAGPDSAVTAVEGAVAEKAPGTFDFIAASDRDDAVTQIEERDTYGAIILGAPGQAPEVLTAPAASAAATQMLTGIAAQLQAQLAQQVAAAGGDPSTVQVTVTAVVPLADTDPTGTGLAAASFPLMLGGMIGGILVSLLVVGVWRRLAAVAIFAASAGIILTLVLQTWFEYLQGDFWLNALAVGVSILATSAFIVGCTSVLGRRGIALAAVITVLFANPLSAAVMPWQFLAEPWGAIGQWFVPGASNTLIRTLSYFPHADTGLQWWILTGWIILGTLLTTLGHFRDRALMRQPEGAIEAPEPATTLV